MTLSRRTAAVGAAGALAVACVAVLAAPVSAATTDDGTVTTRAEAIVEALSGLVDDGTITADQADEVAAALESSDALRGPHGRGGGHHLDLEAAATALSMTEDELRTALRTEGTSLADVAAAQGVETSVLVDALVASHTEHLQQEVADGVLTQEQADERVAELPERMAELVERAAGPGGPGRPGGPGQGGGHGSRGGPWADAPQDATADDTAAGAS